MDRHKINTMSQSSDSYDFQSFSVGRYTGLLKLSEPIFCPREEFTKHNRKLIRKHDTKFGDISKVSRISFEDIEKKTGEELAPLSLKVIDEKTEINLTRYSNPFQMEGNTMKANRDSYYDTSIMDHTTLTCSSPYPYTVQEWWNMVFDANVRLITMVTPFFEGNREKSAFYFPQNTYKPDDIVLSDFKIVSDKPTYIKAIGCKSVEYNYHNLPGLEKRELVFVRIRKTLIEEGSTDQDGEENFSVASRLSLSLSSSYDGICLVESEQTIEYEVEEVMWELTHLHFTDWPDGGTVDPQILLDLIAIYSRTYGEIVDRLETEYVQNLIHCSAGVGRTGTFYVLAQIIRKIILKSKEENSHPLDVTINVPEMIFAARRSRLLSVHQPVQLDLIYRTLDLLADQLK